MYTSGTTGEPKGVILNNGAIIAEVLSIDQLLMETDKVVSPLFLLLIDGCLMVMQQSWSVTAYLSCYLEEGPYGWLFSTIETVDGPKWTS